MDARWLARFTPVARLLIGGGFLLAPELTMRPWIGVEARSPGARLLARVVGSRDLVLGAGALAARDSDQRSRWLAAGIGADAADLALTLAARDHLPRRNVALVSAIAGAGVALGAAALARRPPLHQACV